MQEAELPTEGLISIIDDDEDFREAIAGLMKSRGFTVEAFPSALRIPRNHGVSYGRLTLKHKQPRRRLSLLKVIGLEALGQSRRLIRLRGIARRARRASAAAGAGVRALPWLVGMVLADPAH